ncbi:MAG: hypothetical protein KAU35_00015 [candidate division Zixibacteria bacterium]|nr:hypothetical protein [candidate division Zixibacteria bacterium]
MQIRIALVPVVAALLWIVSAGSVSSRDADKTLPGPDEFVKVDVLPVWGPLDVPARANLDYPVVPGLRPSAGRR